MSVRHFLRSLVAASFVAATVLPAGTAAATPVCTNGFEGGPPLALCGGRVFPEAEHTQEMIQYFPNPITGFEEWRHGMAYLQETYPRWISSYTLREFYGNDLAASRSFDGFRSYEDGDTGDGLDIFVVKITDHEVPDEGKETLLFSLSVHGDEKGGLEGGARAIEDLVVDAENGGTIVDGIAGYPSSTGLDPEFHEYPVADVLKQQAVYFIDFNPDGWAAGDVSGGSPRLYTRGNSAGTDLNRQMPTRGRINQGRSPLDESEGYWGHEYMTEVARAGIDGLMAYGADIHGEGQSRAFADIMYPAGQFDSIKHRQLMSIAERTKSVIDETLYAGLINAIEEASGGDVGEGVEDLNALVPDNTIPTKPARWGTVWDTLGYTDTGFIGDYLASQLGVTGMDYEIALNHTDVRAYGRPWSVLIQENWINATRAIVKTAMAYAMTQSVEFEALEIDPLGRVAYMKNPDVTTGDYYGISYDEEQGHTSIADDRTDGLFEASNNQFFEDLSQYVKGGVTAVAAADIANDPRYLDAFDTLAIADIAAPNDVQGRAYDREAYAANLRTWIERGGNLVLTDRALHLMSEFGILAEDAITDIRVYQPYANIADQSHDMVQGLRGNARQLSEATLIGYEIGNGASPMTVVATDAWTEAGGAVVGTTGNAQGSSDDGSQTAVGQLPVGEGQIRIMGGGLGMPTVDEAYVPYGVRDYSVTYSGLYIMENSIIHDHAALGNAAAAAPTVTPAPTPTPEPLPATGAGMSLLGLSLMGAARSFRLARTR